MGCSLLPCKKKRPRNIRGRLRCDFLETFLETGSRGELVINLVVVLHFGHFDTVPSARGQRSAAARLQIRIAAFDIGAENLGGPFGFLEVFNSRVDVVRQKTLRRTQVLDLGDLPVRARS